MKCSITLTCYSLCAATSRSDNFSKVLQTSEHPSSATFGVYLARNRAWQDVYETPDTSVRMQLLVLWIAVDSKAPEESPTIILSKAGKSHTKLQGKRRWQRRGLVLAHYVRQVLSQVVQHTRSSRFRQEGPVPVRRLAISICCQMSRNCVGAKAKPCSPSHCLAVVTDTTVMILHRRGHKVTGRQSNKSKQLQLVPTCFHFPFALHPQ